MPGNNFIVVLIFSVTATFVSLVFLKNQTTQTYIHKPEIAYDVMKLCDQICNRGNESCFTPQSIILYYKDATEEQMTFRQKFTPYVRELNISSILKEDFYEKIHKRKFCPLDDIDPLYGTLSKRNTCAIIGNGGIILKSKCGREIDSNDLVFRANFANIKGYEKDVGNKTNVMMINDESLRKLYSVLIQKKGGESSYREMLQYLTQHLNDSFIWFAKGTEVHGSAAKLQKLAGFFSDKELHVRLAYGLTNVEAVVKKLWKKMKSYPSSGLDILAVAESLCQNITLYGFYPYDFDLHGRKVLHHYYEPNLTDFKTVNHNFDKEHKMLKEMNEKGVIRLVYDPCEK